MSFRISALDVEQFRHLFGLDADALAEQGIVRSVADSKPGYPCRVSLQDADVGEVLRARLLSVRAFDTTGMMVDADVVDGQDLEPLLERMLSDHTVAKIHIHNAKLGCYLALAERL